jgi:signal transduction histidine kinase
VDLEKDHGTPGAGTAKKRRRRRTGDQGRKLQALLANMSHELRTPLNSVLILAKLLAENQERNLTAKQVEYARTIYDSSTDLLMLINDALDLARLDAGRMPVEAREVSVGEVCDAAERSFRHVAEQKQLAFTVERDPALPDLHTDRHRLQQVLRNLLDNAFKFTTRGEVVLRARAHPPGAVAFAVTDTGAGIAPDQHALIFEPFRQGEGVSVHEHGGTGLGLAISRELARLLGGEILLESAPGAGSTFTLVLPARYPGERESGT